MPKILKHTRENVAHHEAGHAVIAYLTGYHIIDGDIHISGEATEDGNAVTPILEDDDLLSQRRKEGWVIDDFVRVKQQTAFAIAGYTAERFLAETTGTNFDLNLAFAGAHGDIPLVHKFWGPKSFLEFSDRLAQEMINDDVWEMVTILAEALLAREEPMPAEKEIEILQNSMKKTGAKFRLFSNAQAAA